MGERVSSTILGIDTRVAFTDLVAVVALQRLVELAVSRRNMRRLRARGGFEVGADLYPWMAALHTAFLFSCVTEVWFLRRPWLPELSAVSIAVFSVAQFVRLWTQWTLGDRWNTHVIVVPGEAVVTSGPFRWLRHPNYAAVAAEIVSLPLVHGAWMTATVFSVLNGVILRIRISAEEGALRRFCDYDGAFSPRSDKGEAG